MRRSRLLFSVLATVSVAVTALVVAVSAQSVTAAAPSAPGLADTQVAATPVPTAIAFMPDGRMLIASQGGKIRVVANGAVLPTAALDISGRICTNSERGILGLATDPDPSTHAIYVFYTAKGSDPSCPVAALGQPNLPGEPRNRVSRFVLGDDNIINPASETILLDGIYSTAGFHNAGDLHVGHDGYLYVSTGDGGCDYNGDATHPGGSGCDAGTIGGNDASRDRNILNGKILRITTTGAIPASNPFQGRGTARCQFAPAAPGLTCQEAYATGLRNPFRFAFDESASDTQFRIDDVGQAAWEEIDNGQAGADYGWPLREGHCQDTGVPLVCGTPTPRGLTDPIYDYPHTTVAGGLSCGSITGAAYPPPGWDGLAAGSYLFSDYLCGTIFSLSPTGVRTVVESGLGPSSAVSLAFGPDGSLYYTSYAGGGEVRRITPTLPSAPAGVTAAQNGSGTVTLAWTPPATPGTTSITGYRLARTGPNQSAAGSASIVVGPNERSFTVGDLGSGRSYRFTVQALNSAGSGTVGSVAYTPTSNSRPTAPMRISADAINSSSTRLSWSAPAGPGTRSVTGYRLAMTTNGRSGRTSTETVGANTFSVVIPGPSQVGSYTLSVAAITRYGTGPAATVNVTTSDTARSAPRSVSVVQSGAGRATITWQPPSAPAAGPTGYVVELDSDQSRVAPVISAVGPARSGFTFSGLATGHTYQLTVRVLTGIATGPASGAQLSVVPQ